MAKKHTLEIFIEKAKNIHGNLYDYSLAEYVNNSKKIKIICKIHGKFEQSPGSHLSGAGCLKCSILRTHKQQMKNTETFVNECIEKFGIERFDYSLTDYKGAHKDIQVICKKHGQFTVKARSHYKNNGCCSKCIKEKLYNLYSSNTKEFIIKAKKIHNNCYNYEETIYYNHSKKIKVKCIYHNEIYLISPNNHLRGKGCPKCRSSKGESAVKNFLKLNNIKFEEQKKFNNCKYVNQLSFDFYLKKNNLLIEYQGEQHYVYSNIFHKKNKKSLKRQQIIDQIKWQYAKDNNIKLLEIAYWDYKNIEYILKKEFSL